MGRDLPPEVDVSYYVSSYEDLSGMDEDAALAHFETHGKKEGRLSSPACMREGFLKLISKEQDTLEIGPYSRPLMHGDRVQYFDILSKQEIIDRIRKEEARSTIDVPVIDYVSPQGDLSIVECSFDNVFSSHCIEHQPDLIHHLKSVSKLLDPDGHYFLIVPDFRYCFDHFLGASTLSQVVASHLEMRSVHTFRSVLEHRAFTTHNNPERHWAADHGEKDWLASIQEKVELVSREFGNSTTDYVDVHAWQFYPDSFKHILGSLYLLGYTDLEPIRVYHTPKNRFEFTAVLRKASARQG